MEIQPIRNERDYQAALHEIEQLMNAAPGSREEDKLEVLATLVKVYEEGCYPIERPSPIAALEYYLESRGLTPKALEPFIGPPNRVSEIMNRRRRLTLAMVRRLEAGTGIPASILIQPYPLAARAKRSQRGAAKTSTPASPNSAAR
jgi:HTH-type transcriptional regulator/antitoxin HigA